MKTIYPFLTALLICLCTGAYAQTTLDDALPLLQKNNRTAAENRRVLDLFTQSRSPNLTFASGASLVRLPPDNAQQASLFNVLIKSDDMLKKVFSAVILTAMGGMHNELAPLLADAAQSEDNAVRAYAASAYVILNPQQKDFAPYVVNLYIYDAALSQRAMNLLASSAKETFKLLKQAAQSDDAQVRAASASWLGDLQTKDAAKLLLKMAKSERDAQAGAAIALALAKNKTLTLDETAKNISKDYNSAQANTYALALGFMTGSSLDVIRKQLESENINARINSARAAAYMAGVLLSPDASLYTSDKEFDARLLKGLIAQLNVMVRKDSPSAKVYAENALTQIAKLH